MRELHPNTTSNIQITASVFSFNFANGSIRDLVVRDIHLKPVKSRFTTENRP
jgi:hypothetical protein